MSFLLCLAKLRRNLELRKTPQETLLNTSVVWLKCGVKKNFLCVFHKMSLLYALTEFHFRARLQISPEQRANRSSKIFVGLMLS